MSFEPSGSGRARCHATPTGNGLSILVTLVSPLFAVLLAQYLSTRPQYQTTFALPAANVGVSLPAAAHFDARPELPTSEESPASPSDPWQAFAVQPKKQALAKRLIATASVTKNDPASRFVMLRRAKDVATEANDGATAFQAIDAMAETFHSDADILKMSVLTKLASAAKKPAQHKSIAEHALKLGSEAAGQERLMVANQFNRLALAEAERALDNGLLAKSQGRIAEVADRLRVIQRRSMPSRDRRQQTDARFVEKLQPETKQDNGADNGNQLFAAEPKRL